MSERGDGLIVTEGRSVGPYRGIEVSSALELEYRPADVVEVEVRGDSNLVPLVRTEVREGRLVADLIEGHSIEPTQPLRVRVSGPLPEPLRASGASRVDALFVGVGFGELAVEASGAARLVVRGVGDTNPMREIRIDAAGASQVEIEGQSVALIVEASGASRVQAAGMLSEAARLDLSGASNVEVAVSGQVEGEASGASRVRVVAGAATRVSVATSDASNVESVAVDRRGDSMRPE